MPSSRLLGLPISSSAGRAPDQGCAAAVEQRAKDGVNEQRPTSRPMPARQILLDSKDTVEQLEG